MMSSDADEPLGETTIRRPEGFTVERDGPRTFSFDEVSYPCFPLGSLWNGFDNVSISPETRDLIVADWKSFPDYDQETIDTFMALPVEDGRVCLGWFYTTTLDEEDVAA